MHLVHHGVYFLVGEGFVFILQGEAKRIRFFSLRDFVSLIHIERNDFSNQPLLGCEHQLSDFFKRHLLI